MFKKNNFFNFLFFIDFPTFYSYYEYIPRKGSVAILKNTKKFVLILTLFLLIFSTFGTSTLAAPPSDEPQEIRVIDVPGPMYYHGSVANSKLKEIIASRNKKATVLNLYNIGFGLTIVGAIPAAITSAVTAVSASPTARMQTAYDRGENMYFGAYYSTPKPGLTTVPFIYYSKEPMRFVFQ